MNVYTNSSPKEVLNKPSKLASYTKKSSSAFHTTESAGSKSLVQLNRPLMTMKTVPTSSLASLASKMAKTKSDFSLKSITANLSSKSQENSTVNVSLPHFSLQSVISNLKKERETTFTSAGNNKFLPIAVSPSSFAEMLLPVNKKIDDANEAAQQTSFSCSHADMPFLLPCVLDSAKEKGSSKSSFNKPSPDDVVLSAQSQRGGKSKRCCLLN